MKEYKHYTPEQIEQANSADISDYIHSRGFACEKAGKEIHIKGYGGLYVNPETNEFYCHSANKGGRGLLDFCKKILDMPFLEAMREIVGEAESVRQSASKSAEELQKGDRISYAGKTWTITEVSNYSISLESGKDKEFISNTPGSTRFLNEKRWTEKLTEAGFKFIGKTAEIKQFTPKDTAEPQERKEFNMPEKADNGYKNIYAYFINTRSISPEIVREFASKGLIYPTVSKGVSRTTGKEYQIINTVFLHKNEKGEPCGADIQGIDQNPEYRFKGCTAYDESDRGFIYEKGSSEKIDTVYLFEAPIDLMSFVELHPEIENAKFVALSGLKPTTAEYYINSNMNVVSCVDNDIAGMKFNNQILFSKMQDSIGTGENVKSHTVQNGDIPINYCSAEVTGKEISFFISKDDYFTAKKLDADVPKTAVSWINRSNFTVNRECAEAGVKDFNDLLKNIKSAEKEVSPLENTEKFVEETNKISVWSEQAKDKAMERLNDTHQKGIR